MFKILCANYDIICYKNAACKTDFYFEIKAECSQNYLCPLHVLNVLVNLKYSFDVILRSKRIVELRRTIDHLKIHADTKTGPS